MINIFQNINTLYTITMNCKLSTHNILFIIIYRKLSPYVTYQGKNY